MTARGAGFGVAAFVLVATGVLLRLVALDLGWFGIDQARDVATALDVAAGLDAPTLGPTMRRVVRLGAGYYYFWAVPYLVSRDPLAGYWFAAGLSIAAMLGVTALARRLWGTSAALVTLAFAATHPVWVIDGRVAWAPAALPAVGALLLWLLLAPRTRELSPRRAAMVGALLGLAVQLHLTMVAWALAVALIAILERPPLRVAFAGIVGGLVVGLPALVALALGSDDDGGLGGLAGSDAIDVGSRARAALLLGWRVPTALSRWSDVDLSGVWLPAAVAIMAALAISGLGRLVWRRRGSRPARLLCALSTLGGGLVLLLPGEAWWYYLDGLLPVAALAAGAVMLPNTERSSGEWLGWVAILAAMGASLLLVVQLAAFLSQVDRHGYLAVEPQLLSLDARPGADAAAPGRMLSVRWQRAFAEYAARSGGSFATRWQRLHGPALGDVAGDNGFWLRWALARGEHTQGEAATHLVVWYDDAPLVPALAAVRAAEDVELTAFGPLRVARYVPAIDYASCRSPEGPVDVPIRIVPHPKRYGDGRPKRPRSLPFRIECPLRPGTTPVRLVAHLDGPGTVRLRHADIASRAAGTATLCVARTTRPQPFAIEIALPEDAAAAFDLYDISGVDCAPGGG